MNKELINDVRCEISDTDTQKDNFSKRILKLNAVACDFPLHNEQDVLDAQQQCKNGIAALDAKNGLQELIAAQMLSLHNLQQFCIAMANKHLSDIKAGQYFINATVKLSNCCTQQAALFAKLQGNVGQRIIVEHVEVHDGGKAIVGSIQGVNQSENLKK